MFAFANVLKHFFPAKRILTLFFLLMFLFVQVSKREYDTCSLLQADLNNEHHHHHQSREGSDSPLLILNCSSPLHRRRFTILFEPFQAIPNAPEYKPGQSYYFISESWTIHTTLLP